jgi:hypothetical protein
MRSLARSSLGFPLLCPNESICWIRLTESSPIGIGSKTGEMNVPRDSPHTRAALTLPITAPAHPTQESNVVHSRKVVPWQWDSKIIVSKFSGSNVGRNAPVLKTASVLSKSLPLALMCSLRSSPVLEGDKYMPKREEKWLVSTAVSKNITGIVRCTPRSQVAPKLPKATPASSHNAQRLPAVHHQPSASKTGSPSVVRNARPCSRQLPCCLAGLALPTFVRVPRGLLHCPREIKQVLKRRRDSCTKQLSVRT